MSVSFSVKLPEKLLRERGISDFGAVQRKLDSDVLGYCAAFVPKDTGALIASGRTGTRIGSGEVCYNSPYARYQYYGVSKKGKKLRCRGGGLRGAYWFERMKASSKYELLRNAAMAAGAKTTGASLGKNVSIPLWQRIYTPVTKNAQLKLFGTKSKGLKGMR